MSLSLSIPGVCMFGLNVGAGGYIRTMKSQWGEVSLRFWIGGTKINLFFCKVGSTMGKIGENLLKSTGFER
jgi:hypothetical protein